MIGKEKEINDKKNNISQAKRKCMIVKKVFHFEISTQLILSDLGDDLKLFHIVQMNVCKYIIKLF